MLWYAHVSVALAAVSFYTLDPFLLVVAGLVSLLPDLDRPFGHRKWFSHSLLAVGVISFVLLVYSRDPLLVLTIFVALLTHLLVDLLTKSGIPFIFPLKRHNVGLPLVKSSGRKTNKAIAIACLTVFALNIISTLEYTPLFF